MVAERPDLWCWIEACSEGVLLVTEDGRIARANEAIHRLSGYRDGDLLGRAIEELVPGPQQAAHREQRLASRPEQHQRAMGQGREFGLRRADGSVTPVEIGLSAVETEHRMTLAFVTDIRPRKALQDQAEEAAAYRAAHEMLQRMSLTLGHHVRNALSVLIGHAEMSDTPEAAAELAWVIQEQGARIAAVVDVLCELAHDGVIPVPEPDTNGVPGIYDLDSRLDLHARHRAMEIGAQLRIGVQSRPA